VSNPPERTPRLTLLVVFVIALAVRAAVGILARGHGEMEGLAYRYERDAYALAAGYGFSHPRENAPPQVDLIAYADSLGRRGEKLSPHTVPAKDPARWRPTTLHPPGYAGFLAAVYRVVGEPLFPWVRALQAIVDAAACVALFWIVRPMLGSWVARFTAFGCALFAPTAYLATSRVADAVVPALLIATYGVWLLALRSRRLHWFAGSGLLLGLLCLFRPDYLLLPSFLFVGALCVGPVRSALVGTAALMLTALLVLLPWGLRNQRVNGVFNLATHAGGMSLYQGIGQFPNPYGIVFDDDRMEAEVRRAGFLGLDDPGADHWFRERYLAIARHDPGLIVKNALRRLPMGIAPLYRWGYENPHYAGHGFYDYVRAGESPYQAVFRHPRELWLAYWDRLVFAVVGLLLTLASLRLIVLDRAHWRVGVLLALPYLYVLIAHVPFLLGTRLLVPAVFGPIAALGAWAERLVRRASEGAAAP
jgi:4-amino-4-deoxy-L-arabinose transferase-like glycosyltransferase